MPGRTRTATRASGGAANGSSAGSTRVGATRPDVGDLLATNRLFERHVVEHVPRERPRLLRCRLDEVVLRPRDLAVEELLAAFVVDARVRGRRAARTARTHSRKTVRRAYCGRRTHPARPRARRHGRARAAARRRCSTDSHAVSAAPPGWMCSATRLCVSLKAAGRQDRRRLRCGFGEANVTRRRTSVSVRPRGSNLLPTVRGLPVSCSTTGAPSDSNHAIPSSSCSQTTRWSGSSPAGHSARNSSHSRKRQMTQLERSIEPPGRVPFS